MSSTAHPAHPSDNKLSIFVQVAMFLAVITGVEIVAINLPFDKGLLIASLIVMSAVKFLIVIFYFMHLRWDRAFCTILFFIGLILAGGTLWALLHLFAVEDSRPLTAPPPTAAPAATPAANPAGHG